MELGVVLAQSKFPIRANAGGERLAWLWDWRTPRR
jgi:hypothetical protein